ncbi:XAP5, circadian clock regulator-domain-containing protein [Lophiotrema nucula]|uniref:XAP5, circadian clock regulator-domain-containing protein n=1 Tax=Lophiotrema nucula TaxID=690887 RepID=A0A6A5ZMK8_9PLEO|nr:XAP5, circadian clock regulator-domain-containing protein [Lophiotrema nucula]
MDKFAPAENDRSRSGTPSSRFTSQAATAEDLLKEQTVGLVNLSDFRKRRAEALERKEREGSNVGSGTSTPLDGGSTPQPSFKKKRKVAAKGKISFGFDDDEDDSSTSANATPRATPSDTSALNSEGEGKVPKKKLGANTNIGMKPRVMTKSALIREAQEAESVRKDFLALREAVKATEIVIPFVFYDGANVPGGRCRVKKGDHIWLFLDKARKVGAELGVGGDKSRRDWARVSVDDLMLVKGEVIVPHHYEFYYFLFNKVAAFDGPIFNYSAEATKATPMKSDQDPADAPDYNPIDLHKKGKEQQPTVPDSDLEGFNDDPTITKVVDRRWYERNKHIFPASVWQEYNPEKDFSQSQRKDNEGNAFFFS